MKFVMTVTVDVDLNGVESNEIKAALEQGIRHLFGEGAVTGESDAEVNSWDVEIKVEEPPKGCPFCGGPNH